MKHFNIILLSLVLSVVGLGAFSDRLLAQEAPQNQAVALRIAVIDVDSIRRSAAVVNDIGAQITKYRDTFQAEINKEEEKLRTAQQELKKQESVLAADAYEKNRQKFSQQVSEVQFMVQQKKQDLETAQAEAMRKVEVSLNQIIDALVKEENLHLVLRREPVIFFNEGLDITKIVLERLDKAMPGMKVPAIGAPAAGKVAGAPAAGK
ncbi:MAG: hypothetical protein A3G18_00660 [Rhodospirillales bacterium RIFCSPLOWO2_12_FULL_58_28]|nr:MAG: hypothetical protein A3H92_06545 [Rhodospirillales bacterium RIFCSPLOWO2_02_FULL_58_16]OHC77965.1 MAG: hypothetical protein A3G18_00660 [Rhodospirillales bacterium RIFCSPLOWO2_12_FULL_58_28]